ncbi:transporter [Azoarcus sp. DN11]|uniref:transporter n=1 Tax=Azoarcus sp. DN11 TaxID=356837 RepID=UPI000EADF780|nr:transporter [Azoarcus sp. DN11]AYH42703.1 hypothetical protein CDA09_04775 [Azoarcus sp. DN11]
MKDRKSVNKSCVRKVVQGAVVAALCAGATVANAQITRGFIAPHEYSLPDPNGMAPWNVFVEYATLQKTNDNWNAKGDKKKSDDVEQFVGLSKYVHFWSLTPTVGMGWELIVPEVSVRNRTADASVSGIGDPITGPALWIKPNANWTLGLDFFVQLPVGDQSLRTTRWNTIGSVFWDAQYDKFNYTGNLGYQFPGPTDKATTARPAQNWYFNNRFGYRVSELVEPYVGVDYEWQDSKSGNPRNHELGGAAGVMFHMMKTSTLAVHYQWGIEGENRPRSNNLNLRWVYVF